jgi:hypothetical protein
MPTSESDEQQAEKRGRGRPSLGGGPGESDIVAARVSKDQRRKMQQTAAAADLSLSEFVRQSVLREILRQQDEAG